ncbi:MAG TPA: GAF domain-containing protein [Longimicrobiaceae bacterium]|jgi:GAF domain-containing protein|nr:GAF domain-containing protein [Longimicrobiaceae bacterium]
MAEQREAVSNFRRILGGGEGVRAALCYLNAQSLHRFTAVFRFEGGTLRNLHLIDRDDPAVERSADQPVLDSYCMFVRQTAERFTTENSVRDPRVAGHPKQNVVRSYCGVPLMEEDATLFGTICHFDYEPIPFGEDEVYLLETIAPLLIRAVHATEWSPAQEPAA